MTTNYSPLSKITRPNSSGVLPRKRLMAVLDKSPEQPITWISGPAGSGKTTLAANYLDERKLPCLWYQVDAGDADIASFFYYMGLAAQKAAPRYRKPLPLLTPEYLQGVSLFTQRFFENLYSRIKPPFAIVFDNYQEAPEQTPLHDLINIGLSLIPWGIRVFVLSRNEPPPAFARLRANNAMQVVGWSELRFTLEESRQIIRKIEKQNMTEDAIEELHTRTAGWAAGLVLLMEDAEVEKPGTKQIGGYLQPEVFSYFAGEVFDKLDSGTRDFLLLTAFLPTMTVRMAERITDQDNAGRILARLNRNHFFTEKRQTAVPSYQYHPLFREFLLMRLKGSLNPQGILRMQNRAAVILEEAGQVEDAVFLLNETRDWKKLIRLVLGNAQACMLQGRSATLSEWLASVPEEILNATPWLLYWKGICKLPYVPVESRKYLEQAFRLFDAQGDQVGVYLAWSSVVQTFMVVIDDFRPLDPWIHWLDERDSRGISFPSPEIEAMVASGMIGALRWRMPNHPSIKKWVDISLSVPQKGLNINTYLRSAINCEYYYFWMGEFAECGVLFNEMERMIQAQPAASPLMVTMLKTLEALLYNTSVKSNDQAIRSASEGIEIAQRTGVHLMDPLLFVMRVISALNEGDPGQAREYLAKAERAIGNDRRADSFPCSFLSVWYNLFIGDLQQTIALARKAAHLAEKIGSPIYESLIRLVLAQTLCETGDRPEAVKQLAIAKDGVSQTGSPFFEYLYCLTEANLAFEHNDDQAGLKALVRAMTWGRQKGYLSMVYFWRPVILSRLCSRALEAGIEIEYVQNLIRTLKLAPDSGSPIVQDWPWALKIHTLGRFELVKEGEPVKFTGKVQQKPLALLKALIAFGGKNVPEEQFVDALWPDADGDLAHRSFEMAVHRLRKLVGNDKVILLQERRLTLDTNVCWVDVWAFEHLQGEGEKGRKGLISGTPARELMQRAIDVYKGNFLPGDSAYPWILSFRERLRSKFNRLVIKLGTHLAQAAQWKSAVEAYQKGLEVDDRAEEFYQHLMVCYQQLGQRAEAMAVYTRCNVLLSSTLGIAPSPRTEELYQSIKKGQ